ncbi:MAG: hypothetical protein EAZ99_18620 [Alphaproteobacteria bacterium]|nr:MAG: hypothetical protein EAZ99_18620 [Alphaproteobacteria bacterium]
MRETLQRLGALFRATPKVSDAAGFAFLMGAESARIANKATIEYCRARTGVFFYALSEEKLFQDALEVSRWEAFAAVLQDVFILGEGVLRDHAVGRRDALADGLEFAFRREIERWPIPAHRTDWEDVLEAFPRRLRQSQLAEPKAPDVIAKMGGAVVWSVLPLHERYKNLDRDVVIGNLGFQLLALAEQIHREVELAPVARDITTWAGARSDSQPAD